MGYTEGVNALLSFLQQNPIVVEVLKQPAPSHDISIDFVLAMFKTAGVAILLAAIGGLIVGGLFIAVRRVRDGSRAAAETPHVRLRI